MVRHEAYRALKYEAKMDPDAIKMRFAAHKENMVEQMYAKAAELVEVERKAKQVCELAAVPVHEIPAYLNFARQCYRISKQFSQNTKINEVYFRYQTWVSRGLTASVLASLSQLCNCDIADYPATP